MQKRRRLPPERMKRCRRQYEKNPARILHVRVKPKKAASFVPMPVVMRRRRPGVVPAGIEHVVRSTRTIRRGLLTDERVSLPIGRMRCHHVELGGDIFGHWADRRRTRSHRGGGDCHAHRLCALCDICDPGGDWHGDGPTATGGMKGEDCYFLVRTVLTMAS